MSTILRLGKVLRAREFSKTLARRTFRSMVNRLTTNPRRLPPTHVRSRRPRRGPLRRRGPCPLARPERYADLHPRRGLAKRSALNSDRRALARPPARPRRSHPHALTHSRTHNTRFARSPGYIIYGDLVLDVSTFRHPGGRFRLQRYVGKDATAVLDQKHNAREQETARSLAIGTLAV